MIAGIGMSLMSELAKGEIKKKLGSMSESSESARYGASMTNTITAVGIVLTFGVAAANLFYSIINNKKTRFINTVTTSRIQWINSLRDKVSAYIAVTIRLLNPEALKRDQDTIAVLVRERDTLKHQVILHLNPKDPEDQAIKLRINEVDNLSNQGSYTAEIATLLLGLRDATGDYLKKEWEKVKNESEKGRLSKSKNE